MKVAAKPHITPIAKETTVNKMKSPIAIKGVFQGLILSLSGFSDIFFIV